MNWFERLLKNLANTSNAGAFSMPGSVDRDIATRGIKRAQQRQATRSNINADSNFWKRFSELDKTARERYQTANPTFEADLKKKHPEYTNQDIDNVWTNRIKRDYLQKSKHPEIKKLYQSMFDENGNLNDYGKQEWANIDNEVAKIAMENDLDGLSDEKEKRAEEKWYEKLGKAYLDTYDPGYTTMREAAKTYLDKTKDNDENASRVNAYQRWLGDKSIQEDGKSRKQHVEDFDKLASLVSSDYEKALNPEQYKDLQEYDRLKDVSKLRIDDDEKLKLYAQFIVDEQRGGEKYAAQKLAQYFQDKLAEGQTKLEKAANMVAGFTDDFVALTVGATGLLYGIASATGAGIEELITGENSDPWSLGLGTEEDKQRRHGMRWWQRVLDNPIVQWSSDLMDTHVWNSQDQARFRELQLTDNDFYKTVAQQESAISLPDFLAIGRDYGFTAAMTAVSYGTSFLAKQTIKGALAASRAAGGATNAAKWSNFLRNAVKGKDVLNTGLMAIASTAEGAQVTLQNKVAHYHEGLQGLDNKYFEQWVRENPETAAKILISANVDNVPLQIELQQNDGAPLAFSDEQKEQLIELFNNPDAQAELSSSSGPNERPQVDKKKLEYLKQQALMSYKANHADEVAIDQEQVQDRVEDSATAEFFIQAAINGFLNHSLKNTLNAKPVQQARKNVANRMRKKFGGTPSNKKPEVEKHVKFRKDPKTGKWSAEALLEDTKDLVMERVKESFGEMIEEGSQDVGGAFGTGYYNYSYQNYINSRFGDKDGINTAAKDDVWHALWGGIQAGAESVFDEETLRDAFFGGLSSGIGGLNVNQNFLSRKQLKESNKGKGILGAISNISNYSPVGWRGAWTPLINRSEINQRNQRNQQLAQDINAFLQNEDIQQKLTTAGGIEAFIKEYSDAIANGDEFAARNAKFGSIFSIANLLDKLKGTAYHDMVTNGLNKRMSLGEMGDDKIKEKLDNASALLDELSTTSDEARAEQIKEELKNNDVYQALKEYKNDWANYDAKDKDVSGTDTNVADVKKVAENAAQMKTVLDNISEKREQIQKDFGAELDDDGMDAVLYQQMAIQDRQDRRDKINEDLHKITPFSDDKQADNTAKSAVVQYGSLETLRAEKEEIEQARDDFKDLLEKGKKRADKLQQKQEKYEKALADNGGKPTPAIRNMALTSEEALDLTSYREAEKQVAKLERVLKQMEKQDKALSKSVETRIRENQTDGMLESRNESPVLTEREIMELDAASRAFMLNEKNKGRYSAEQQKVIDALNTKGRQAYGKSWDEKIQDASRLEAQIHRDNIELNNILLDSKALNDYVYAAKIAKLKREKTNQYEKLFVEAEDAVNNYDEDIVDSVERRNLALSKLSEFLETPSEDWATAQVKKELKQKYALSEAMQQINEQNQERVEFHSDMKKITMVTEEEEQLMDGTPVSSISDEDGVYVGATQMVYNERELSDNDRDLIDYAIAYSARHHISLDQLPDAVTTEDFRQFVTEQNEQNKEEGDSTNVTFDPADARKLLQAAVNLHNQLKEDRAERARQKEAEEAASRAAQSVATEQPQEPEPEDNNDNTNREEGLPQQQELQDIPESLDVGVANLLNRLENMNLNYFTQNMSEDESVINQRKWRKEFRDAILEIARTIGDDRTIADIQNALVAKFQSGDLRQSHMASTLASMTINSRELENEEAEQPQNVPTTTLETQDLNKFYPSNDPDVYTMRTYIDDMNIYENFNKIARKLHEEKSNNQEGPKPQVMFLYDPALAKKMAETMGESYNENNIPIVLVIPVTEENKKRFGIEDNQEGLIDVGPNHFGHISNKNVKDRNKSEVALDADGNPVKDGNGKLVGVKYMPIGIMPASNYKKIDSASNMKGVRDLIDTGVAIDGQNFPRVLRHRTGKTYGNGTPKESGGRLTAFIDLMDVDDSPQSNVNTPLRELSELGAENVETPEESIVGYASKYERARDQKRFNEESEKAKQTKSRKGLRATNLYKKIRAAIHDKLTTEEKPKADETGNRTALEFDVSKGTRAIRGTKGQFTPEVIIKSIEETTHREDPEVKLIDLIRSFSETNDNSAQVIGTGSGNNGANSRLTGMFIALRNLLDTATEKNKERQEAGLAPLSDAIGIGWPLESRFFNEDGSVNYDTKDAYDKAVKQFEESFMKKMSYYLNIAGDTSVEVKFDETNPVDQKTMTITVKNNGKSIASISLGHTVDDDGKPVREGFNRKHAMSLIKQLVLTEDGKPRTWSKNNKEYPLVKWEVNYNQIANSKEKADIDTYNDLYDDGVFTLRLSKLAYKPKSITMTVSDRMRREVLNNPSSQGSSADPIGTGAGASHETRSGSGFVLDSNSGMPLRTDVSSADITTDTPDSRIPKETMEKLQNLLSKSASRKLTEDEKAYDIDGQIWARVTSIKRFFSKSQSDKFDEDSPWGLPSTTIGNSLDSFGRDVFNNMFDGLKKDELLDRFSEYPNSTKENYMQVYLALKSIQANLAEKGQTILGIGDADNPGQIVVRGHIPIEVDGVTKLFRCGGTLDVLAIDQDGNLHIYDFKTYHSEEELNEEKANSKDYNIQLSLYAQFLEKEYGLKPGSVSISIIPVHTPYPSPSQVTYSVDENNPEQLLVQGQGDIVPTPFAGAAFKVGKPFALTRLTNDELVLNIEKMLAEDPNARREIAGLLEEQDSSHHIEPESLVRPEPEAGPERPPQIEPGNQKDPKTMTDKDIRDEISELAGTFDDPIANERREALTVEQEGREEDYQSIIDEYPAGTPISTPQYGDGEVTGYAEYDGNLCMEADFNGEKITFPLRDFSIADSIDEVPGEVQEESGSDTSGDTINQDQYGEEDDGEEDIEFDDINDFGEDSDYDLSPGESPAEEPSDHDMSENIHEQNGEQSPLKQHEDDCS